MKWFVGVATLLFSIAALAGTTEPSAFDVARTFREQMISLEPDSGFFEDIGLRRGGSPMNIGFFGGDASAYFDPAAQSHLTLYRDEKIVGISLYTLGFAAVLVDLGLQLKESTSQNAEVHNAALEWGLLGGGVVVSTVGLVLVNMATRQLFAAVNSHNAALVNRFLPNTEATPLALDGAQSPAMLSFGWKV